MADDLDMDAKTGAAGPRAPAPKLNLEHWKYYYTAAAKADPVGTAGGGGAQLLADQLVKAGYHTSDGFSLWLATYKYNDDLPKPAFMANNYVNGIFQRVGGAIRKVGFARALLPLIEPAGDDTTPRQLSMLWAFEHPQGADCFLVPKKPKKAGSGDDDEYGDDTEDEDNRYIHGLFQWRRLDPAVCADDYAAVVQHLTAYPADSCVTIVFK